jgi:ectoine hydroxylase-related dioxygenase (phytanoyl-CoA dioxygenase family)
MVQDNNDGIAHDGISYRDPMQIIPRVKACEGAEKVHNAMLRAGCVVIEGFLTREQVTQLDQDLDGHFESMHMGAKHESESMQQFHGKQTKRITNVVNHSKVYRHDILDMDLVHSICERAFAHHNSSYWMSAAQGIEINPGNSAQCLHRDQGLYPFVNLLGPAAPEAMINFLVALTPFTEQNGATRVIPGSHKDADFLDYGHPSQTLPAEMNAGDALLISGKTLHGGGANRSLDERRRGLAFSLSLSSLTPEEAYPFQISMETARTMTKRAQRMVGFRSVYPSDMYGLWQWNASKLEDYIDLDK